MTETHNHDWVSLTEVRAMNLANCKGETGPIDLFPALSKVDPTKEPAVCFICYQIAGQPEGVREESLIAFEQILRSFAASSAPK